MKQGDTGWQEALEMMRSDLDELREFKFEDLTGMTREERESWIVEAEKESAGESESDVELEPEFESQPGAMDIMADTLEVSLRIRHASESIVQELDTAPKITIADEVPFASPSAKDIEGPVATRRNLRRVKSTKLNKGTNDNDELVS